MNERFINFYNLYKNDVFRLALSYTRKINDAEDITQNVFIKLYKNIDKIEDDNYIKKWCMITTVNECKDFFKSFWRRNVFSIDEKNDLKFYKLDKEKEDIKNALFKLKPKYRMIIYLHYFEGYKIKEIADILNYKENSIKVMLVRAREKLKYFLKEDDDFEKKARF